MAKPELPADVIDAMKRGQKIEAIRLLREQTELGLAEAKQAVEAHEAANPAPRQSAAPGAVSGSGGAVWLILVLVIAAVAGFFLLRG